MKKFGKFVLTLVVLDYIRISTWQAYNIMKRIQHGEGWLEAANNTGGRSWKEDYED